MQHDGGTLTPYYAGWDRYNGLLMQAVAPLTADQLALRAGDTVRPAWLLAAHIIGARAGWFHGVLDEGDTTLAGLDAWDDDDAPPRTAGALVSGLEATWNVIRGCLEQWTPAMLDDPFTTRRGRPVTRQWVLWHVLEHDLHHGGELCLTLGAHGIAVPDL